MSIIDYYNIDKQAIGFIQANKNNKVCISSPKICIFSYFKYV